MKKILLVSLFVSIGCLSFAQVIQRPNPVVLRSKFENYLPTKPLPVYLRPINNNYLATLPLPVYIRAIFDNKLPLAPEPNSIIGVAIRDNNSEASRSISPDGPGHPQTVNESMESQPLVSQNYPNPFSSRSTISVEVTKLSNIRLVVTSTTGQQVIKQELMNVGPGRYEFSLDRGNLAPGLYFYNVQVNDKSVSKQMIVE
jgi:hypothetical protein